MGRIDPSASQHASAAITLHEQHAGPPSLCTGGQGVLPYEQKTQQSPGFARTTAPHDGQSQKNWHLSVGISAVVCVSQWGHVIVDVSWTVGIGYGDDFRREGKPAPSVALVRSSTETVSGSKRITASGGAKVASAP